MNWTASLLRNELSKQKLAYESRINLLTNSSIDVQNFLHLEKKLTLLTTELETAKQNISQLENELKEKESSLTEEINFKSSAIKGLEQKISTDKDFIFKLQKDIRELKLYHQQEIKRVKADYQSKLTPLHQQIKELKAILNLNNSEKDEKLVVQQTTIANLQTELNETANSLINVQQDLRIVSTQNNNLNQQLTILITQKEQAQTPFEEIENIIKANKILLFPIKKKLKERVKEIKTAFQWGEVAQDWDLGDSRSPTPLPELEKPSSSKKGKKSLNWRTHGVPFLDFTEELTQRWISNGFTKIQCQEWLNIGMQNSDASFCAWLRDIKQKDAEWMLNYGQGEELRQEFERKA